jgi:hypothetical protein
MEFRSTMERFVPLAALGAALGLVGLSGCSTGPELTPNQTATVVGRDYDPPYTTVIYVNKVPIIQYHPADYDLFVRQCGHEGEAGADPQGCIEGEIDVTQEVYEQTPDGSQIVVPE